MCLIFLAFLADREGSPQFNLWVLSGPSLLTSTPMITAPETTPVLPHFDVGGVDPQMGQSPSMGWSGRLLKNGRQ
jgi:hypothetical protein